MNYSRLIALAALLAIFQLAACEKKGPAEKAGERIDEASEELRSSAKDLASEIGDAGEDLANKAEDACEDIKKDAGAENTDC